MRQELALLAIDFAVDQNGSFNCIPIVRIVWRWLKIPGQFARIGIQRDNGFGVKVVALAALSGDDRLWIAGPEIKQIRLRVISV